MSLCPTFVASGTCGDTSCSYSHDIPSCSDCGLTFATERKYALHLRSKQHLRTVSGAPSAVFLRCGPCDTFMAPNVWGAHVKGRKHLRSCSNLGISNPHKVAAQEIQDPPGTTRCTICNILVDPSQQAKHNTTNRHTARMRFAKHEAALDEAEKDKNGVIVLPAGPFDFGILEPDAPVDPKTLTITTQLPVGYTQLLRVEFLSARRGQSRFAVDLSLGRSDRIVSKAKPSTLSISLRDTTHLGRYSDRLDLYFEDTQLHRQFIISRSILAIVGSQSDHRALRPQAPYTPRRRGETHPEVSVEPGIAPPALKAVPYQVDLPIATLPRALFQILSNVKRMKEGKVKQDVKLTLLPATWNEETYSRQLKYLLWMEEFQMERDLETYDIPDAKLTRHGVYHYLAVPGLAEKRPSVLVGDRIIVHPHGSPQGMWFEGRVHVVRKEEVGLRFSNRFQPSSGQQFIARFKLNRYPLRRQHQALDTAFRERRVLFPSSNDVPSRTAVRPQAVRLKVYNALISSNAPQLQAVTSIARLAPGCPPFIIFGPPGTGKTMTVVESILQVLSANSKARIIACAPSNSAADIIALRLSQGKAKLGTDDLFRFYAPSRSKNDVPYQLEDYTYKTADGIFSVPLMARFKRFRVVVTTCISASVFYGIGVPRGHYSHIFIDEAGQATEPECMIGVMTMADKNTNIILSGDPQQLGPIIRSNLAAELGLEVSLIERLMKTNVYDVTGGYGTTVVKLVKNFRSHEAILRFPNDRFYKGELETCAESRVMNAYLNSAHVVSPKFPIVFYAISGQDDREASSPSFFNIDEASQVKRCITQLRSDRKIRISDADIGVISPYHAQCLKIRTLLRSVADGVKVGSVEEFQGQERKVIIISTVRSSKEFVKFDLKHTLGFVANPRRFNVAVTRAQALLIVIGDPHVLSLDPLWRSFLNYVYNNGGWKGGSIPWDPREVVDESGPYAQRIREAAEFDMNEFTRQMEELALDQAEDENNGVVDRAWRDVE